MGKRPGPAVATVRPLDAEERAALEATFLCPECRQRTLLHGERLVRHPCSAGDRPVAWRGYDGELVILGWWNAGAGRIR